MTNTTNGKVAFLPLHFHFIWQHFPLWCLTIRRGLAQSSGFDGIPGHFVIEAMPSLHLTTPPHSSPLQFSLFRSVRFPYWQWNSVRFMRQLQVISLFSQAILKSIESACVCMVPMARRQLVPYLEFFLYLLSFVPYLGTQFARRRNVDEALVLVCKVPH